MVLNIDLLEAVSMQADCTYLSDLKHMSVWQWNEALNYIVRSPPRDTPQAARERLFSALSAAR